MPFVSCPMYSIVLEDIAIDQRKGDEVVRFCLFPIVLGDKEYVDRMQLSTRILFLFIVVIV